MEPDDRVQDVDALIRAVHDTGGSVTEAELTQILDHVARAGFDEQAREAARGPLRGQMWQGQPVIGSTRLPPAVRHWLLHALVNREWPVGTTLAGYIDSLRRITLDPDSGVFVNTYQSEISLGIMRESRELRGPGGHAWILVQYRVSTGHWTTGFQPEDGLEEITKPDWGQVRWMRRPTIRSAPS